jgi:hypothetical protein
MSLDDLWMQPVAVQGAYELDIYREQFAMIVGDLLKLPRDKPILVEGAAQLPFPHTIPSFTSMARLPST